MSLLINQFYSDSCEEVDWEPHSRDPPLQREDLRRRRPSQQAGETHRGRREHQTQNVVFQSSHQDVGEKVGTGPTD